VRRRIIREKVLQALYAREISGDPVEHIIRCILPDLEKTKNAHEFAKRLVIETINNTAQIDKVIRGRVDNWDFRRLALIDRLILRMAICELIYFGEIPPKVTMNEAIELAKLFSTERSGEFVNGVLDGVVSDMKKTGQLSKEGRGLVDAKHLPRKAKVKARRME
jgi:N utilization substance protein B